MSRPITFVVMLMITSAFIYWMITPQRQAPASQSISLLAIADVYQLLGTNNGKEGGMARVRALRAELEKTDPNLVLLVGGDFLSPSFEGLKYKGEQMIDLFNLLDGNDGFDQNMYVTFGNHEFDDSKCNKNKPVPLPSRISESDFRWLGSNLDFSQCGTGLQALLDDKFDDKILTSDLRTINGLSVGFYGLILDEDTYKSAYTPFPEASCRQVHKLRGAGAQIVVALTHLDTSQDLHLRTLEPDCQPDVVIGGHNHIDVIDVEASPPVFKPASDARTTHLIRIELKDGTPDVSFVRYALGEEPESAESAESDRNYFDEIDAPVNKAAHGWRTDHDEDFCRKHYPTKVAEDGECLRKELTTTQSLIEAEELQNRRDETAFGNWLADRVREAAETDVVFINSGSMRLNYNLPPGSVLTRRHTHELFPFAGSFGAHEVKTSLVVDSVIYAYGKKTEGAWLHLSGVTTKVLPDGKFAVSVSTDGKPELVWDGDKMLVDASHSISITSTEFILRGFDGHANIFAGYKDPNGTTNETKYPCVNLDKQGEAKLSKDELDARDQSCGKLIAETRRWPWISDKTPADDPSRLVAEILLRHQPLVLDPIDNRWCEPSDAHCI